MVVISYSGKEANAKIVYYGPGLGGKTTNLEFIYDSVPASSRGKLVSMKTQTDRTLFFDFLPLDLGELGGFKTRFLLYTVPGQVFYNATRKLVLRGADAVAFIADSQIGKMEENKESLANLEENLAEYDLKFDSIPWVIQYNKRDLPDVYTIEELNRELNPNNVPYFEAVSTEGTGVFETFRGLSRLLLEKLSEEIGQRMVIGRSLGRKQERDRATEATEENLLAKIGPACEPEEVELESIESANAALATSKAVEESIASVKESGPSETEHDSCDLCQVSPEASEVDLEELEILAEETGASSSESELVVQPQTEPEPIIAHEREILRGFFGEIVQSTPLEKEIVREEVILSKESDLEVLSQSPVKEQVTERREWQGEPSTEQAQWQSDQQVTAKDQASHQVREPASEQVAATEMAIEQPAERQPLTEQVTPSSAYKESSGEEPFFLKMVRRNNTGVFGEHKQEAADQGENSYSHEEPSIDVKSLEHVIEIPASMLNGQKDKEIVITLRLKLKTEVENKEEPAEEFLLDGISR